MKQYDENKEKNVEKLEKSQINRDKSWKIENPSVRKHFKNK